MKYEMNLLFKHLVVVLLCVHALEAAPPAQTSLSSLATTAANFDIKQIEKLPADIPTCRATDANLNDCLKAAFQLMTPRLKDGIKDLNIPPLDPFVIERTNYEYNNGVLQGHLAMRNVRVYGMSEAIVQNVDFQLSDDDKVRMEVITHMPNIRIEGTYKADMTFNDIRLTPKGYFNMSMTDVTMLARPEGELYTRENSNDGHKYLRLTKFTSEPDVGDMHIYASGLLPDPNLNALVLDFINQYWQPIYKIMLPETRTTWEPLMINLANEFFAALPFDFLLTKE